VLTLLSPRARIGRGLRAATVLLAAVCLPCWSATSLEAQRRPGVGMGFYTYTGLVSAELEGGSVVASSAFVEAATIAISGMGTVPLLRVPKRAWIAAVRVTPLNLGNRGSCVVIPEAVGCQDTRFEERASVMTGGAFDIRATLLRVMVGGAYVSAENSAARFGPIVRVDFTAPRQGGSSPTLFLTRTFLGMVRGESAGLTTVGAGYRWVRKR
jgi:hypothetical protein